MLQLWQCERWKEFVISMDDALVEWRKGDGDRAEKPHYYGPLEDVTQL